MLHSIAENYVVKVAVEKQIGRVICFQGVTARIRRRGGFRTAARQAHPCFGVGHLTGAIGAALVLSDAGVAATGFRGLDLYRKTIPTQVEVRPLCANHCKITVAYIDGESVASGFLCGRDYKAASRVDRNRSGFEPAESADSHRSRPRPQPVWTAEPGAPVDPPHGR